MVSNVDYWTLLAEDELDGTYQAPWAIPDKKTSPEEAHRREIFQTLSAEQRAAVRELLRHVMKGQLHLFCVALDQTPGGSTILLEQPNAGRGFHPRRGRPVRTNEFEITEPGRPASRTRSTRQEKRDHDGG